ncbi:MAG: peptide deformylase [Rhodospirillaceae bacterium]|nr:peptide deformylase [Rhodospirillaceae bacterium]
MAILKVARMGHPVLRRPADSVIDPHSPEIRQLVADMLDTMRDEGGVGLAATQVHVPLRLVMFHVPAGRAEQDGPDAGGVPQSVPLTVLINPEIEPLGDEKELGWEACLSVPGLTGVVPRWRRIRYRGVTPTGETIEREAEGFHARVVQHECDHLDGILYPMRMTDLSLLGFADEMHRAQPSMPDEDAVDDLEPEAQSA